MNSNEHINLPTFEFLPKLSKKAKNSIDWMDIFIQARIVKENAVTAKTFGMVRNLFGTEVRGIIHYLRVVYKRAIASGGKGYFTAHHSSDLNDTIDGMNGRINSIIEVRDALVNTQKEMRATELGFKLNNATQGVLNFKKNSDKQKI